MSVEIDGDMGTIVRMNSSATLNVKFANQLQYGTQNELSPTWNIRYFNAEGKVIAHYEANECVCRPEAALALESGMEMLASRPAQMDVMAE